MRPELSIVVPSFNEEESLPLFYDKVSKQLDAMGGTWEIVLVDDGSRDRTAEVGKELCQKDTRVKLIRFSRNFGSQVAISAGLDATRGEAVVVMDADLQQPPELLPEMVRLWREEGFHIVHAVRKHYTEHTSFLKRLSSRLFYKGMNFLSDTPLIPGASEFRLMDRRVVNELKNFHERARFLRGMVQWLGYRVTTVEFQANERVAGVSSFSPFRLLALAFDGMISFSTKPLRWIVYLGFFTAIACLPYALWAIYQFITMGQHGVPGWSSLIVAVIFLGGVQLISLGVIGEYVGRIYTEVKARPLYIVQERFGFDTEEEQNAVDTQRG